MDLLQVRHPDFIMTIECPKFDGIWDKAVRNITIDSLVSTYSWSDDLAEVCLLCGGDDIALVKGEKAQAVFFDNADYPVWIDFSVSDAKSASFSSILENENEKFAFRNHVLAGFLNYGNDIGKSELSFSYKIGGLTKSFTFAYDVLSSKLDYHNHWRKIVEDIEREYRMLSLDYMKRTFHGFSPGANGEENDLIWWSIFESEQIKFINACKAILEQPRHRLRGSIVYQRADKLKRVPVTIENELAEHRVDVNHLYRVEVPRLSNDTPENRFLKYAVAQIASKYENLKKKIEKIENVADNRKEIMVATFKSLKKLERHPFFRTVGLFKGLSQENSVLQKATNYSKVFQTWYLLRRAYSLYDGMFRLQTKDIATLYEIWCFIEVSHIVKEQLNLDDSDVDHKNRMEMNGLFTWELGRGEHSRILYRKDNVELAELVYNPKHTATENDNVSIDGVIVPTVPQKPDIVLQLTKHDLRKNMKMTYLFDAKYRIGGKLKNEVDYPPEDAINQMHRYRDAIYYKDYDSKSLKKEVVGGYILFPGDGKALDIQLANFQKTIDSVNIGAFPLRPKDEENRKLLEKFISRLLEKTSTELLEKQIPQKGLVYSPEESSTNKDALVMVAYASSIEKMEWAFSNGWYNVPVGKMSEKQILESSFLLLKVKDSDTISPLYRIVKSRVAVWSSEDMVKNNYPGSPNYPAYFMLGIEKLDKRYEYLQNQNIDISHLGVELKKGFVFRKVGELINR